MRYFHIDPAQLGRETPVVAGAEARHMMDVLRLGPGDRIGLLDGSGRGYEAEIGRRTPEGVEVSILAEFSLERESPAEIVVAQAMLKEKKMDRMVRHLTELGVSQWRPVVSQRSIPRLQEDRLEAKVRRWEKIALEAMKQCRRGRAPQIFAPVSLAQFLRLDLGCALKIALWESESERRLPRRMPAADPAAVGAPRVLLLLGPEGGFAQDEIRAAEGCGFVTAGLGPRVLRAETATIAAVAMVQYLYGDMG